MLSYDPARIGLLGASAGAHLAALAALSGKKFLGAYPHDPFAATDTSVKALVGVYGVYDMHAMWCSLQVQDGRNSDNKVEKFIGAPPHSALRTAGEIRIRDIVETIWYAHPPLPAALVDGVGSSEPN
jgi:acetyl esterase/lipase